MTPSEVVISKSLTSALELSEAFLIAETLDPADVGFSLAFHCMRQSLLVLCDSPYLYTEMAVTVRQRGFQLASTLDGGTLGTDYPVSSLTRPSPWKRPL